jgi:hypothetical protein
MANWRNTSTRSSPRRYVHVRGHFHASVALPPGDRCRCFVDVARSLLLLSEIARILGCADCSQVTTNSGKSNQLAK